MENLNTNQNIVNEAVISLVSYSKSLSCTVDEVLEQSVKQGAEFNKTQVRNYLSRLEKKGYLEVNDGIVTPSL
jgi:predicted transcriptional regulator of viral defense system